MSEEPDRQQKDDGAMLNEAAARYRADVPDGVYPLQTPEDKGWEEFREQCRRQMKRPMESRIKYGFCRPIGQVPGKTTWRAFETTAEYRAWCEANLPDYLGYKRPAK